MNEIEKTRKELDKGCGKRIFPITNPDNIKCGTEWANDKHYCEKCMYKLIGFNLGIQLAQKDFLDKFEEIDNDPENNISDSQYWKWQFIKQYAKEIKQ